MGRKEGFATCPFKEGKSRYEENRLKRTSEQLQGDLPVNRHKKDRVANPFRFCEHVVQLHVSLKTPCTDRQISALMVRPVIFPLTVAILRLQVSDNRPMPAV